MLHYYLLKQIVYVMILMKIFFDIMYQHKQIFDSSNYSKNSKYFCIDDKKVLD